ncbi:MAG: hypothetical protein A2X49_01550 [Lentisphaerae bacterium GWF2_52_8]|nr:MAG: hypothetical protein A2X49_01550 [Lentisphaerae bacterium GWF2_52_8]
MAIKTSGLHKSYGKLHALCGFDMEVPLGGIYGLLGPNGAGKTTVMKILLGLCLPDRGNVQIFGRDLFLERSELMRSIGAIVEAPVFHECMSARENLRYLSRLSGKVLRQQINDALDTVGLSEAADRKVGGYSYGMKQRLGIAQTLLPENKLIFLDEPTNGLDPHGILGVRELIRKLSSERKITILLSSHLLSEVEQLCDKVLIMDKGSVIREGLVCDMLKENGIVEVEASTLAGVKAALAALGANSEEEWMDGERAFVRANLSEDAVPDLNRLMVAGGVNVFGIKRHKHTLEDIFVEHTGKHQGHPASDRF